MEPADRASWAAASPAAAERGDAGDGVVAPSAGTPFACGEGLDDATQNFVGEVFRGLPSPSRGNPPSTFGVEPPAADGGGLLLRVRRDAAAGVYDRRSCAFFTLCTFEACIEDATAKLRSSLSQRFNIAGRSRSFNGEPATLLGGHGGLPREDAEDDDADFPPRVRARLDSTSRCCCLYVPLPSIPRAPELRGVLAGWLHAATQSLVDMASSVGDLRLADGLGVLALAAAAGPAVEAIRSALLGSAAAVVAGGLLAPSNIPLLLGAVGPAVNLSGMPSVQGLATHVGLVSLTSAIMFILSIRGLNKHSTSQRGNMLGILATALGILSVLVSPGFHGAHVRFFVTFLLASVVGYGAASQVSIEQMPELVAGFHSFVGLAAVFAGLAGYCGPLTSLPFDPLRCLETILGISIGMLTFTGSVVAAGKLHGWIPGRPVVLDNRWAFNIAGLGLSALLSSAFCTPSVYSSGLGVVCLLGNTAIWAGLGANMVLPIGGADMPVVVSILNSCSGLATSAMGFMLSNNLLTIAGALVASSGYLLSDIMCRGINRSMGNVLMGGFGVDDGSSLAAGNGADRGNVTEVSAASFVGMLLTAKRVCIVPGYGLAVARCQQRLAEIVELLRSHGVVVHFAIHPVAGRLPGHMNVLLAEADVPYDIVKEMDEIHPDLPQYDVAIVIGANDIVNPSTKEDTNSQIYGMPVVEVWSCKTCVVLKRSMATGYSGVDNPLFYRDNVRMLFGDARTSLDHVHHLLEESQERIQGGATSPAQDTARAAAEQRAEEYPVASKVVGVIRERRHGERRVSIAPSVVPALRRLGFSVLLEAGAGLPAGFGDEEYVRHGEVRVAESAAEVLQQADVVLKANEPLLDEVQMLKGSQTMVGFWNSSADQVLLDALGQSQASFVNLALVPRVSRAQRLDALTSMANIAGYRAVLDAFNKLPRFSRSAVTAVGSVPPARVFVIGVGVAGLSAIATAHALGAKVFANDVRSAVRDQVKSLGAEFVPIEAEGIAGEGAGGYATEMDDAFKAAQLATYARVIPDMDIVITSAMIPNRAAPLLIPEEVVRAMRRGSVIVDLAAQTGGNCALTQQDQTCVSANGVFIIGETNYPAAMASQASEMLGSNFAALLETLGGAVDFGGEHWEDPIVRPATIAHQGRLLPPVPPPPPAPAAAAALSGGPVQVFPQAFAPPGAPDNVNEIMKWLMDHQDELAFALGGGVILGLGFGFDIPEHEVTNLGHFVLSLLIGHFTVASVTPALHTPLIAVTNAISGIIVIGGMLQLSGPLLSARVGCALAAVFLSSINIAGGFAVTHRMLEMFREDSRRRR